MSENEFLIDIFENPEVVNTGHEAGGTQTNVT